MEKPEYATQDMWEILLEQIFFLHKIVLRNVLLNFSYDIMLSCWDKIPKNRPNFDSLEERISNLMEEDVVQHFIVLNEPNAKKNEDQFEGKKDYLAEMSPPGFQASPPLNASDFVNREDQAENSFECIEMKTMSGHNKIKNEPEAQSLVNNHKENYVENSYCEIFYSAEEQFWHV